jgi:uncharacterized protein YjbI with pentapeptide repeats
MNSIELAPQKLFPLISAEKWQKASAELSKHLKDFGNDNTIFNDAIGCSYKNNQYLKMSIKRVIIKDCRFSNCEFIMCASTGSTYKNTYFKNCYFTDSNFQFTDFSQSTFIYKESINTIRSKPEIIGSNFSYSNFDSTKLMNINLMSSTFTGSSFINSFLDNCVIESCTFEETNFEKATLKNMDIENINIEFADFYDSSFENVSIPLMQIHYTFGGLIYFFENKGLTLRTDDSNNIKKQINKSEYLELLPSLEIYFQKMNEYFPLANIYLAKKEFEKFDITIRLGIKVAIMNKNIRQLINITKLAKKSNILSAEELKNLYYEIIELIYSNYYDTNFFYTFTSKINIIQSTLLNYKESTKVISLRFVLERKNNLLSETECLTGVISELQNSLISSGNNIKWNKVIISRNTPLDFTINFDVTHLSSTLQFIMALCGIFFASTEVTKRIESILEKRKKKKKIKDDKINLKRLNPDLKKYGEITNISITNNYNIYISSDKDINQSLIKKLQED